MEKIKREKIEKEKEQHEYLSSVNRAREIAPTFLLTTSARDYTDSIGRELSDFYFRSIDASIVFGILERRIFECKRHMIEKALQLEAEVVVDIYPIISGQYSNVVYMIGTALIPKQKRI